jgi:hypothetical protein
MPQKAFERAINQCLQHNVDFILITGDLFHTSLPSIDVLKLVVKQLNRCKKANVPVYIVPGSHDFSPSGKTMLSVLEEAELVTNVAKIEEQKDKLKLKFTTNVKTGVKLTGMVGRKGSLEKDYFQYLDFKHLEQETGFKIFVFHSAITELKPKHLTLMESVPLSLLPKNFNYYAAGHVHEKSEMNFSTGILAYPGALFPTDFKELRKYNAGLYIVSVDANDKPNLEWIPIKLCEVDYIELDVTGKTSDEIDKAIEEELKNRKLDNSIVLLKLKGVLDGSLGDIDFKGLNNLALERGAIVVKRSVSEVQLKELTKLKTVPDGGIEDLEHRIIKEHTGQIKVKGWSRDIEEKMIENLMKIFQKEKQEGETNAVFEERIKNEAKTVLLGESYEDQVH